MSLVPALLLANLLQEAPGASSVPWGRDDRAALATAQETGRPLLVLFTSASCTTAATHPSVARARTAGATGSGRGGVPDPLSTDVRGEIDDCRRMEEDVWSRADVVRAAARFVPLLSDDTADRTLARRYEVATVPTLLVADPWGHEILRLVRYTPADKVLRILDALPRDFRTIEAPARVLAEAPRDPGALLAVARFYEGAGLREVAALQYERAGKDAPADSSQELALARATNLMALGRDAEAVHVVRAALEKAASGALADALLFAWTMAELRQGRAKDAEKPYQELLRRYPASKYTARAKENMAAARR